MSGKPLSLLICLAVQLRCHNLLDILNIRMVRLIDLVVPLDAQIYLLICWTCFSNCHSKPWLLILILTWSLSENCCAVTLTSSLILNNCICCLLVLFLLLNSVLLRIILSLLIHFYSLFAGAWNLLLPLNIEIRCSWWLKCRISLVTTFLYQMLRPQFFPLLIWWLIS